MKKSWSVLFLVVGTFFLGSLALQQNAVASSNENVGVVVLHGNKSPKKWINPLLRQLKKSNISVVAPHMTWSEDRAYDCSLNETYAEIDKAISQLKKDGATKIFLGGHSMGASASAAYAVNNSDLSGLILIAPGHTTAMERLEGKMAKNIAVAKEMIASGKSNKKHSFKGAPCDDVVKVFPRAANGNYTIKTTPEIFLSYYNPGIKDTMVENIRKVGERTAVLMIVGSKDSWVKADAKGALTKASNHPQNKYIEISGSNHLNTPDKGKNEIVSWVEKVAASI